MMVLGLIFTSCEEDPFTGGGGGIFDNPPSAGLLADPGFVTGSATVTPGEVFMIRYSAVAGDAAMESVVITENGSNVDFSRISINGSPANSNPILLFDTQTSSFTWDIAIEAQSAGSSTYSIIVTDQSGETQTTNIDILLDSDVTVVAPTLNATTSGMLMVEPNSLISIPIAAQPGSSPLAFVAVSEQRASDTEDNLIEDLSRLSYGGSQFSSNPQPLSDSEKEGLENTVQIRVGSESATYFIFILDENNEFGFSTVEVSVGALGTPVDILEGVLWNSAGPAGFGGLDLDEGIGTGSTDPMAEIRDAGANFDLAADINWLQQIGGTQGSILREVIAGQNGVSENYDFDNVTTKEELVGLYDGGIPLSMMDANQNPISRPVAVGFTFAVENSGRYYLIKIKEINIAPSDNSDNYVIDIKK